MTGTPKPEITFFLCTGQPGQRATRRRCGAAWFDGDLYFTSGPGTRKSRHLAVNRACTFSVRLPDVDLVLDGEATRVTDRPTLERLAAPGSREDHGIGLLPLGRGRGLYPGKQ